VSDRLRVDPIAEARRHWIEWGWETSAPGMAVITSIVRCNQLVVGRVDAALQPFGLTFARYEILMLLLFSRRGALPMGKMGERLQVHPASVTSAVAQLETDGLVRRRRHPEDGRSVLAIVTARGRRVALKATDTLNEAVFGAIGLPEDETEGLFALLRQVRVGAGDFADENAPLR
jgi:DNA-binding MarR family transcriptional regulator